MSRPEAPIEIAIIGAGLMGRWHADAARRCGARIAAICDLDRSAAAALAAKFDTRAETDTRKLFDTSACHVVHICSPVASHRELALQALEAGSHVIIEKPFAPTPKDTDAILDAAAQMDRMAIPVHQFGFQTWVPDAATLGRVVQVRASTCSAGADGSADPDRIVDEILPHPLSLFDRLFPGCLADATWTVSSPEPGELLAHAELAGASCAIEISMRARPTRNELFVSGLQGSLYADLFHGFGLREGAHTSRAYKIARPFVVGSKRLAHAGVNLLTRAKRRESAYPGLRALIAAAYRHVGGTGEVPLSPVHVRSVERSRAQIIAAR